MVVRRDGEEVVWDHRIVQPPLLSLLVLTCRREKSSRSKETGEKQQMKRIPAQPREARTISLKDNKPENITPVPYETTI